MATLTAPVQFSTASNVSRGNSSAWEDVENLFTTDPDERVIAYGIHENAQRSDFLEVLGPDSPGVVDTDLERS